MAKYRYKPNTIEAVQFDGENWAEMSAFCGNREVDDRKMPIFNPIGTYLPAWLVTKPEHIAELYLERHRKHSAVKIGDWAVKGMDAHLILVDDTLFRKLFEETGE